jgi:hypothetical protein
MNMKKVTMIFQKPILLWLALLLIPSWSQANLSFEGYLTLSNGSPAPSPASVEFKILSGDGNGCTLYSETQGSTIVATDGYVALDVGAGTRTDGLPHSFVQAFDNSKTFAGLTCVSGGVSYTPAVGDRRFLNVRVNGEDLGSIAVNLMPIAASASSLSGFVPGNLLRVENSGVPGSATAFNSTQFADLMSLISGTSALYTKNSLTTGAAMPISSTQPVGVVPGSVWYNSSTNQLNYYNGSASVALTGGAFSVVGSPLTNGHIWIGSGSSMAADVGITGDATLANSGALTVNGLNNHPVNAPSPTPNQYLKYTGSTWVNSGIDTTDIISGIIPVIHGGTNATSFAPNGVIISNGSGSALQALNCPVGQVITFDVSGYAICGNGGAMTFQNGGNTFGSAARIGTNDSNDLKLKTNNLDRVFITAAGNVGVGITFPMATLQVSGSIVSSEVLMGGSTVSFQGSNSVVLTSVGGSIISLTGMVAGGHYTLVVEDPTSRQYTFSGCSTSRFSPINATTTTSTVTIYEIYYRTGGTCYIHWASGY